VLASRAVSCFGTDRGSTQVKTCGPIPLGRGTDEGVRPHTNTSIPHTNTIGSLLVALLADIRPWHLRPRLDFKKAAI